MVSLFQELFRHQAHADSALLAAIQQHANASNDEELRKLLHHILVAHRFWLHLCQGLPFSVETEDVIPATLDGLSLATNRHVLRNKVGFGNFKNPI